MPRPSYKVRTPAAVAGLIRHLHPQIKRKLRAALERMAEDPHAGKPLKDKLTGYWSFRIGKFRAIYRFGRTGILDVVAFGPRETIYEETYRLVTRERVRRER